MLFAGLWVVASLAAADPAQTYRYHQAGTGGPVVVFENGVGATLETWKNVQDEASRFTTTFSYNRAGYEGSPPAVGARDAATVVGELRALLAERRLSPPYVLVGHSLGGLYMQYFARNFPEEVAGLVLVDSTHWAQFERIRQAAPSLLRRATANEVGRMPEGVRQDAEAAEFIGREVSHSAPLVPMPLIVLSAGRHPEATVAPALGSQVRLRRGLQPSFWLALQREMAAQLPGSRHTVVRGSGHFIQTEQPQVVTAALREVVESVRGP